MKRIAVLLIIGVILLPCTARAEGITLTLDEALALSLRDNRDILLQAQEIDRAKAMIKEAKSGLYPTVNATAGMEYARGLYDSDKPQFYAAIGMRQYLYQGGRVINTIAYDGYKLQSSQALLDKVKLDVALNVMNAFYTLIFANDYAALNKAILENTKEHLAFRQSQYEKGEASQTEILNITSSLTSVEEAYEASLNDAEAAQELLRNLLYLDNSVSIIPEGNFTFSPEETAYEDAFVKAMEKRPEIRQYVAEVQAQKKAIEIAKSGSRPNVYASWDYYSSSHVPGVTGLEDNRNDYNVIGVVFSWPIFDGWLTKARVEQAIVDLKETQLLQQKTVKDIASELKTAYLSLKTSLAEIKSGQAEVDLYKDAVTVNQTRYTAGMASGLDMSDVNLRYRVALFNQEQAAYDYAVARARFQKAMGE